MVREHFEAALVICALAVYWQWVGRPSYRTKQWERQLWSYVLWLYTGSGQANLPTEPDLTEAAMEMCALALYWQWADRPSYRTRQWERQLWWCVLWLYTGSGQTYLPTESYRTRLNIGSCGDVCFGCILALGRQTFLQNQTMRED